MVGVGDILNDDFFGDVVDTPNKGIEHHKKWEKLKGVIDKCKAQLLRHKWTYGRVDKESNEIINEMYVEYKQRELNEKGENTAKALESMPLIYILAEFLILLKLGMLKN